MGFQKQPGLQEMLLAHSSVSQASHWARFCHLAVLLTNGISLNEKLHEECNGQEWMDSQKCIFSDLPSFARADDLSDVSFPIAKVQHDDRTHVCQH
jgi:hypothetical protein